MRLFVALSPPAAALAELEQAVTPMRESWPELRWVGADRWHVTLAFLGEVDDERAPDAAAAVQRAAAGPPVELRLAGGGRFGRGQFTVLWVGVSGDGLDQLARRVRREIKKTRIRYDERKFRPHLTVARPGDRLDRATVEADRAQLAGYRGPSWPVTEIRLMRSHLGPSPTYDRIGGWPLAQ
jgi:2'-5' RNA ligase